MVAVIPASRFVDKQGRVIFSKIERQDADGLLGADLTWRTAVGAIIHVAGRCFYAPLFFWRNLC